MNSAITAMIVLSIICLIGFFIDFLVRDYRTRQFTDQAKSAAPDEDVAMTKREADIVQTAIAASERIKDAKRRARQRKATGRLK